MPSDWEVVGKKKKEIQNAKKAFKQEQNEIVNSAPKIEDLLPPSQVAAIYSSIDKPNSNNKKKDSSENKKKAQNQNNELQKAQKKPQEKKKKTNNPNNIDNKSRTIEAAIASIKFEDLKNNYQISKARFDDCPLLQLKSFTAYLTSKLVSDQNKTVFSSKCFEYPLKLFPEKHRHFMLKILSEVSHSTKAQLYESCLLALVNDMTHGNPVSSYKIILQILASNFPNLVFLNINQTTNLIKNHTSPNKIAISTALLWIVAQAGNYSLQYGLEAWKIYMVPFMNQKNYTRYSIDYIKHLLARYNKSTDQITIGEFIEFTDILFAPYNIPKAWQTELHALCKPFRERTSSLNTTQYFGNILDVRLKIPYPILYRQEIVAELYTLLQEDPISCFQQWQDIYNDNLPESVLLLRSIYKDWNKIRSNQILPYSETKCILQKFDVINKQLYKEKDNREGLDESNRIIEALLYKMTARRSSPLRWIVLISLFAISAFVAFDISHHHGNFQLSKTGRTLKQYGVLSKYDEIMVKAKHQYAHASKWFSQNGPTFLTHTVENLRPYVKLFKDLFVIFSHVVMNTITTGVKYVAQKLPLLHEAIESYAPGITEMSKKGFFQAWQGVLYYTKFLVSESVVYLNLILTHLKEAFTKFVNYLQNNVFVGDYSPENLQKLAFQGLTVIQEYASSSARWISVKINDLTATQAQ